jgi:hypothetical protein
MSQREKVIITLVQPVDVTEKSDSENPRGSASGAWDQARTITYTACIQLMYLPPDVCSESYVMQAVLDPMGRLTRAPVGAF